MYLISLVEDINFSSKIMYGRDGKVTTHPKSFKRYRILGDRFVGLHACVDLMVIKLGVLGLSD